jgi:hypothetical protein
MGMTVISDVFLISYRRPEVVEVVLLPDEPELVEPDEPDERDEPDELPELTELTDLPDDDEPDDTELIDRPDDIELPELETVGIVLPELTGGLEIVVPDELLPLLTDVLIRLDDEVEV